MGRRKLITKREQDIIIKTIANSFSQAKSKKSNIDNDDAKIIVEHIPVGCCCTALFFIFLGILYFVAQKSLNENDINDNGIMLVIFVIASITSFIAFKHIKELDEENFNHKNEELDQLINSHIDILTTKYNQLVYKDDYGLIIRDRYLKELDYFTCKVLFPNCNFSQVAKTAFFNRILNIVETNISNPISKANTNPYEFEYKCAEILQKSGWQAHATQASGDQGVDVVGEKNGIKVVIQCKLYSKPVGNKAVQEVFSGKDYYNADYAAVVSNQAYTASARQLAHKCGVLLLSYEDLSDIDNLLN